MNATGLQRTRMQDLVETLRASLADDAAGRGGEAVADASRDAALAEYRQRLVKHIRGDLAITCGRLTRLVGEGLEVADRRGMVGMRVSDNAMLMEDLVGRLDAACRDWQVADMYASSKEEERCWLVLQQYYCDALELAQRAVALRDGRMPPRAAQRRSDGTYARRNFLGIEGYGWPQTLAQAMEVAVPNSFAMCFRRTLWPTLRHMLWHQVIPWGGLKWRDFEATTLGWLSPDGLERLRRDGRPGAGPCRVRFEGRGYLEDRAGLLTADGTRFRHNVIVAASHRVGFLDFPFWTRMLQAVPHGVWANNSFYTPGMARKLARGRQTVAIRGLGRVSMSEALDRSVTMLAEDGAGLFVIADGSQPNMMYGHQMRIKRGVRVLADECVRQTAARGRRTFVVPLSFDDPLSYLLGLDDEIVVRCHPPLEVTQPSTPERYRSVFDEEALNGGDALLNHLEALFLVNSMPARHDLVTPDVIGAVERRQRVTGGGARMWLRNRFNTSVFELSRHRLGDLGGDAA